MTNDVSAKPQEWPSIDDHEPDEEGGPTARSGLAYQDEIVVGMFLDMIADPSIQKIHYETHDDIVVKRVVADVDTVEYVQVKSNEPDKLWSVTDMCANGYDSLCAKSLARDSHKVKGKLPDVTSKKGNGIDYWLEHCSWQVCHNEDGIRRDNILKSSGLPPNRAS
jgi:hypothetical protein